LLARARAIERHRSLVDGLDPIDQRDTNRGKPAAGHTFADVMALELKGRESGWRNAKHRLQWRSTLDTYAVPVLGGLPVAAIATGDLPV